MIRAPPWVRRTLPPASKHGQIAPDGGNRNADVLGKLFQRRKFNLLEIVFNSVLTLFCRHLAIIWKILKDFAR